MAKPTWASSVARSQPYLLQQPAACPPTFAALQQRQEFLESTYHKNIRLHQGKCQEQAEAHNSMHKRLGEAMKKVDEAALKAADAEAKVDRLEAQAIMERIDADAKVERLEAQVKELQKQLLQSLVRRRSGASSLFSRDPV